MKGPRFPGADLPRFPVVRTQMECPTCHRAVPFVLSRAAVVFLVQRNAEPTMPVTRKPCRSCGADVACTVLDIAKQARIFPPAA